MKGLSNNQLKILALIAMTIDHIGMIIAPWSSWMRIIGRLAFPIFAFMIAEGCRHTRSMGKYLGTMASLALVCQVVSYFVQDSLHLGILITFSISIGLIWLVQIAAKKQSYLWLGFCLLGTALAFFVCQVLPGLLPSTDFGVEYGFIGVLVPVAVYFGRTKRQKLLFLALALAALSLDQAAIQWYCLLAVPVLALYNKQRGSWNLKWLFYIYYPLHLAVIYIAGNWV